jgi:HAD superfamily 5'-nucleotidase-like hydrolase
LDYIEYKQQHQLYGSSTYIDLTDPNYDAIDTSFSISFATLFSQLVDLKDKKEHLNLPDYRTLASNLIHVLDQSHRDGSLKGKIADNLDDYIIKNQQLVLDLEKYKLHDKKIVVITNSDYHYTKLLLDYAINPFLKNHTHWNELFEFTITSAQKPRFFFDNLKFLKINVVDGTMTNLEGPLEPGVYQGGCADVFANSLCLKPEEILYIGDHIYGDVVRLKKDCAWRTALVVEELDDDINNAKQANNYDIEIQKLMDIKIPLETELNSLVSKKIEKRFDDNNEKIDSLQKEIHEIDHKISPLISQKRKCFNPFWGEIMRTGIEPSFFASQVERYACIYFSDLKDFFSLSPRSYLRSEFRKLPHEK